MTLDERVDRLEKLLAKNEDFISDIKILTKMHTEALVDHKEWLGRHEQSIAKFENELRKSRQDFDERMKLLDQRIEVLVSGFGAFINKFVK